jgi:hypothetical protein
MQFVDVLVGECFLAEDGLHLKVSSALAVHRRAFSLVRFMPTARVVKVDRPTPQRSLATQYLGWALIHAHQNEATLGDEKVIVEINLRMGTATTRYQPTFSEKVEAAKKVEAGKKPPKKKRASPAAPSRGKE